MFGGFHHCGPRECGPRGRRGGGPWAFAFGPGGWGGPGGQWSGGPGRGRMFGQGDLKFVVLNMLAEKPRHGYEIIKELEERFGGAYAPSPGTVYPTLTMLEDLGFARVTPEEGGRKIYEITEEGRKHLAEHSQTVDGIFDRIARFLDGFLDAPMMEVNQAFKRVGRATYGLAPGHLRDRELLDRLKAVLDRAADEI